jgi:hypothetical protein
LRLAVGAAASSPDAVAITGPACGDAATACWAALVAFDAAGSVCVKVDIGNRAAGTYLQVLQPDFTFLPRISDVGFCIFKIRLGDTRVEISRQNDIF